MNVDRLARGYRWVEYAAFGRALERARFQFLDQLATADRVLMLGEGDGRALARLLSLAPQVRVEVVEVSGEMIALARGRAGNSRRVQFLQQDALNARWPAESYDGITTLFFLDCFGEVEARRLIKNIVGAMRPGALWLVSDFAVPAGGWRNWHARAWLWIMFRFFAVTTGLRVGSLPPMERLLREAGLERVEAVERRAGLIRSEVWRKVHGSTAGPSLRP